MAQSNDTLFSERYAWAHDLQMQDEVTQHLLKQIEYGAIVYFPRSGPMQYLELPCRSASLPFPVPMIDIAIVSTIHRLLIERLLLGLYDIQSFAPIIPDTTPEELIDRGVLGAAIISSRWYIHRNFKELARQHLDFETSVGY